MRPGQVEVGALRVLSQIGCSAHLVATADGWLMHRPADGLAATQIGAHLDGFRRLSVDDDSVSGIKHN